jgi:hypothetical protein
VQQANVFATADEPFIESASDEPHSRLQHDGPAQSQRGEARRRQHSPCEIGKDLETKKGLLLKAVG